MAWRSACRASGDSAPDRWRVGPPGAVPASWPSASAAVLARLIILSMMSGVHGAGDDRDGLRFARGRFRVGAGQVAGLAGPYAEPRVFQFRGPGQLAQL